MKIADFLEREGLSGKQLASLLGYSNSESVNARRRRDEDIPEAWLPRLRELGYHVNGAAGGPAEGAAGAGAGAGAEEDVKRVWEQPPAPPEDAPRWEPVHIDYSQVAGYIEGAYRLAARIAVEQYDPLLAGAIDERAADAGRAWAHWIESEPRVAALLQRLMIGTPLGEVIGVHAAIIFAYVLARSAAREVAAAAAPSAAAGAAADAAPDYLAGAEDEAGAALA